MRFGPPEIRKCLSCSQLVAQHILWSGNTFGAKYWTDGKITAGMLPNIPDLGRCPHCQSLMWFSDGTEVEKNETASSALPSLDLPAGAKFILPPVKEDYLQALSDSFYSSKEQELNLRFGAWHAANDKFRIDDALGTIIANWFRKMVKLPPRKSVFDEKLLSVDLENMEFLYCLLDESNVHERVMKAELARELGRFQEAISLLQYGFESDQRKFVDTIKKLAQEQNQIVTEVKMN